MCIRITLEFLKNTNAQVLLLSSKAAAALLLSSQAQRQPACLALHRVCLTFSLSCSVLAFHSVCFLHLFVFDALSQVFIKHRRKAFVYIYVIACIIYIS